MYTKFFDSLLTSVNIIPYKCFNKILFIINNSLTYVIIISFFKQIKLQLIWIYFYFKHLYLNKNNVNGIFL
jgi:hypothetical protein